MNRERADKFELAARLGLLKVVPIKVVRLVWAYPAHETKPHRVTMEARAPALSDPTRWGATFHCTIALDDNKLRALDFQGQHQFMKRAIREDPRNFRTFLRT